MEKPFWEHIEELRARIMRCLWVFLLFSIVAYFFREPVMQFLKAPLFHALPEDKRHLYFTGLFENFMNHLKVSMITGLFFCSPYFFYQLWGFVSPGLHQHEKRLVVPFVTAATLFFLAGAAFAYYFVFPVGFKFFVEFGAPQDIPLITVSEYFSMLFRLFLLFGLSFEFPVILIVLAKLGLVTAKQLKTSRRFVVIGIAAFAALCAPPDVLSMLLMMLPLLLFFEVSILIIQWLEKKVP